MSALSNSLAARKSPILCYVTDRGSLPLAPSANVSVLARKIATLVEAGVDWVQIREKDLSARPLAALAQEALRRTQAPPNEDHRATRILINDRVDIALTEGTAGVHLGEGSLPVEEVRAFVQSWISGKDFLIGVSCHSLESAKAAAASGADYIFFGPVFATPSKAAFGAPHGVSRLAEICRAVAIPVLAIGGITLENAGSCVSAGAAGIAAIGLFQGTPDPGATVEALRKGAQ